MDWFILILGVPAVLIPLVLLFGFAGCGQYAAICTDDVDCPVGTQCVDGACVSAGTLNDPPPPSAPENLAAIALDDRSVSLTWTNTDPAATDFRIERAPEDGDFAAIPAPADLSPTGATDDDPALQEGVTYIYRVRALVGEQASAASDTSSATVFPAAPVNLVATPQSFDRIDLSWSNASAIATAFSLEHRVPGGTFAEILPRPAGTTFSHTGDPSLVEGTPHEYRVFAIVDDGVENDVAQEVKSAPSAVASATTLTFTAAFDATGVLTTDQAGGEGFCTVQRLSTALLTAGGTRVRMVLRGSTAGDLTFDKVTISQVAATGDRYDSAADLTEVASGVSIPANATVTVGPVNYTLDPTTDLIVAFDISNTPGQGNVRFGPLPGGETSAKGPVAGVATAEAIVQDRTTGYPFVAANNLNFIERIEVV